MSKITNNQLGFSYIGDALTQKLCPLDTQTRVVENREFISNIDVQPFVYIIVGEKRSGKTTLCVNLLNHLIMEKTYFTRFFLVTPSAESDSKWGKYLELAKKSNTYYNDVESQDKFKTAMITIKNICQQDIIAYKKLVMNALQHLASLGYDIEHLLNMKDLLSHELAQELNHVFDHEPGIYDSFKAAYVDEQPSGKEEEKKRIEQEENRRKLLNSSVYDGDGKGMTHNPTEDVNDYHLLANQAHNDKKYVQPKYNTDDDLDAMDSIDTGKDQDDKNKDDTNMFTGMDDVINSMNDDDHVPLFMVPNNLVILDDIMAFTGSARKDNVLTSLFTNSAHLRLSSIYMAQKVNGVLASAWVNHDAVTIYPFSDAKEEQNLYEHISHNLFWRVYIELKKTKGNPETKITHPFVHLNRRGLHGGIDVYRLCDYVQEENTDMANMKPHEIMNTFSKTKNQKPIKSIYPHMNK